MIEYIKPYQQIGYTIYSYSDSIKSNSYQTLNSSPVQLIDDNGKIRIPIAFLLTVRNITNVGNLITLFIGTQTQLSNTDCSLCLDNFLSGASPADTIYSFYPNDAVGGAGVALGEIYKTSSIFSTIYLYSPSANDPTINIANTNYTLFYIEI